MPYPLGAAEDQPTPSAPWLAFFVLSYLVVAHLQIVAGTGRAGDFGCDPTVVLTAVLGMIYGSEQGLWLGCVGGLFHDLASGPAPIGLFAMTGLIVGHLAGSLWAWTVRSRWGVAGLLIAGLGVVHALLVQLLLRVGGYDLFWPDWNHLGLGLLAHGLLGAVLYAVLNRLVGQRWL